MVIVALGRQNIIIEQVPGLKKKKNDVRGQGLNSYNTEWDMCYGQPKYWQTEWIRSLYTGFSN